MLFTRGMVSKGPHNKPRQLNPHQAIFVREYLRHGNGKAAAIAAGYTAKNAAVSASILLKRTPAIIHALDEMRKTAMADGTYNLKVAMQEAKDAMDFAKETENANAYTKAVELRSKLNGLLIEKHAHLVAGFNVTVGGIDFGKRDGVLEGGQVPMLEASPVPEETPDETPEEETPSNDDDSADDLF